MEKEENAVFHGGIPVDPDVNKLVEMFGDSIKVGYVLPYSDIIVLLDIEYPGGRFESVVTAFRDKILETRNVDSKRIKGYGIQFLDELGRIKEGVGDANSGRRKIKKGYSRLIRVENDKLNPSQQKALNVITGVLHEEVKRLEDNFKKKIDMALKTHFLPR